MAFNQIYIFIRTIFIYIYKNNLVCLHLSVICGLQSFLNVPTGADPKSVVCAFYKQGSCSKGDKCKFSHDISLERKGEKRSMYVDTRDEELKNGEFFSPSI